MDEILSFFQSLIPTDFNWKDFLISLLIFAAAVLLLGLIARLIFGKKSLLNRSISSAISILFIYIVTVLIHALGADLSFLLSPLPFVSISGEYLHFQVDPNAISSNLLSMVILSFLANMADSWLPNGKGVFSWFFFRCISVLLAMVLHVIVTALISALLPEGLLVWAPRIALGALILMILLGALKLLFALTSPLFAALHSFFFGHQIGKMIYKAVLTTVILALIVYALNSAGISTVYIAASALTTYVPVLVLLLIVWYVIGHLL